MAERRVPRIRFKGFEEDWEQRKLGEMSSLITKGTTPLDESNTGNVNFVNIESIDEASGEITITKKITNEEHEGYLRRSQLKENDILFSIAGTLGRVTSVKSSILPANTNQALAIIRRKTGDLQYVKTYLKGKVVSDYIKKNPTIGAQPNLSLEQVGNLEIALPILDEQKKIGEYFSGLNNLISLHQRKLEKLKILKKAMLEKMFPKNGAKVPEIRFSGFTDDWEQRKVGEFLTERNDQAPMSDEYPLMAFIANEGVAPKGERYDRSALVNDTVGKLYKKTEFGDFIYSSNNLETGSIGLNKYGRASISPVYSIFHPTGLADSDFIGRRFVRKDFINAMVKWRQGVIYGQWRIHESDFIKIEVAVPSVKEQRKIGAILDQLDTLISLHQRKLEKLRQIKKSMLERMFV